MENNKKIRDLDELYELYIELGHDAFEEIIKPMGVCLHNSDGNAISMNSLNTIILNAMEKSKLGEASLYENDLFSSPALEKKIALIILCLLYVIILRILVIF